MILIGEFKYYKPAKNNEKKDKDIDKKREKRKSMSAPVV